MKCGTIGWKRVGRAAAAMHDETTRAKKQSKMRASERSLPPSLRPAGRQKGGAGARHATAVAAAREEEKGMTHQ